MVLERSGGKWNRTGFLRRIRAKILNGKPLSVHEARHWKYRHEFKHILDTDKPYTVLDE